MKLSNIKDILKDWAKGSYHFGRGVSNYVADKMEVSPEKSRVGTAVFDTVAGAGLTFMAASSALGTADRKSVV